MENNHFNVAWAKSTALYTKAASVLGVGYPEMMVLYALESMGELTQKQIAENFGMQKTDGSYGRERTSKEGLFTVGGQRGR